MAKATRTFYGTDSQGRTIEVAKSVSGLWFYREWEYNGYAMSWSKWQQTDNIKDSDISVWTSEWTGVSRRLEWGFGYLMRPRPTTPKNYVTDSLRSPISH